MGFNLRRWNGTAWEGAGADTFATAQNGKAAARVVVIGDSIENSFSTQSGANYPWGMDWPTVAMLLSGGKFQLVRNAGVSGENTSEYLARFDTAFTGADFNTVVIGGPENDIQENYGAGMTVPQSLAAIRLNIEEMVGRTVRLGAKPVLRTCLPHFNTPTHQAIGAYNAWVRDYGARHGVPVLDFWRVLVDPVTGNFKTGESREALSSAVHPNDAGTAKLGQHVVDTLCAGIHAQPISLSESATDPGNLVTNPLFLSVGGGVPNWFTPTLQTGLTRSIVTDPLVPGNMARMAMVATAGATQLNGPSSGGVQIDATKVSEGDVLEFSGLFTTDGGVAVTIGLQFNTTSGQQWYTIPSIKAPMTRATFRRRVAVPAGTTLVQTQVSCAAGTGVVDVAHPSIRNLTREGIA